MLWTCLHFPELPLQVFIRASAAPGPLVIASNAKRPAIVASNPEAKILGVKLEMTVSAAQALVPNLSVRLRDEANEAAALSGIAAWAQQFTPHVSLSDSAVLLEIGGCLSVFGGREPLLKRIRSGLDELGYKASVCTAPTALGALLLARAQLECEVTPSDLIEYLSPLPISLLDYPQQNLKVLSDIGIRTIADCMSLPRDGVARRFGQALLDQIDRAMGKLPDPRPLFKEPQRYCATLNLPFAVTEIEALLFAAKRLLGELCGFLSAQNAGVTRLRLNLKHEDVAVTSIGMGLSAASRDPEHLLLLLRERLWQTELPRPVEAIELAADELTSLPKRSRSLFKDNEKHDEHRWELIERLRARLGDEAVHGLQTFPDYRPEFAWRSCEPGEPVIPPCNGERPAWLLSQPRPLSEIGNAPWLDGRLVMVSGPERIESGWWDGIDIARDYFVARNPHGASYWIFKERKQDGKWFLHGVFA